MSSLIPPDAYKYFPSGDKLFIGSGRNIVRFIFYQTEFTQFELDQLNQFKSFLDSTQQSIPEDYRIEEVLRAIIGCKFNHKKTITAIQAAIQWRLVNMPQGITTLYTKAESLLNSGSIYIHGRDHRYRPLIILNAGKLDLSQNSTEDYCDLLCFILEYCCIHLMVPGHIENWIVITDLNDQSLSSLPISDLKVIIKTLQDNFRCRMIVNYIVNAPRALKFIWSMIKGFIEAHTVNKIRILREGKIEEMKQHFALHQFEEKYGGTAQNLTDVFWPPVLPPEPFEAMGETPGAHLDHSKVLPDPDLCNEEIFYSFSRSTIDRFSSRPFETRHVTTESRYTVYADPISHSEANSINSSQETLLPPAKPKKCCEKCSVF